MTSAPAKVAITDEVLGEMTRAIVDAVGPDKIVLFGSRADRNARPDSDLDLLIVTHESFGPGHNRWTDISRIRTALHRFLVPKDVLLYSADEIARLRHVPGHVIATCLARGKTLYERP